MQFKYAIKQLVGFRVSMHFTSFAFELIHCCSSFHCLSFKKMKELIWVFKISHVWNLFVLNLKNTSHLLSWHWLLPFCNPCENVECSARNSSLLINLNCLSINHTAGIRSANSSHWFNAGYLMLSDQQGRPCSSPFSRGSHQIVYNQRLRLSSLRSPRASCYRIFRNQQGLLSLLHTLAFFPSKSRCVGFVASWIAHQCFWF
jgi:hypothetical protein